MRKGWRSLCGIADCSFEFLVSSFESGETAVFCSRNYLAHLIQFIHDKRGQLLLVAKMLTSDGDEVGRGKTAEYLFRISQQHRRTHLVGGSRPMGLWYKRLHPNLPWLPLHCCIYEQHMVSLPDQVSMFGQKLVAGNGRYPFHPLQPFHHPPTHPVIPTQGVAITNY